MKILKIIVWDQVNYDKVIDMVRISFKYYQYIDVVIGDDNNDIDFKLYIGYNSTIANKPELMGLIDITDNQISNKIYWSFGYTEDRVLFGKYLKKFVKELIIRFFEETIRYECIDYIFSDDVHSVDDFIKTYIDIDKVFSTGLSYYFTRKSDTDHIKIYNISLKMVKFYEGADNVALLRHYIDNNNNNCLMLTDNNDNNYIEFKDKLSVVLDDVLCERNYVLFN